MSAYRYYTNYYAEEKEKELLIRQLTAQLEALKLNQKDYIILQSQAQLMNEKYTALQVQKEKVGQAIRHKTALMDKHLTEQTRELQRLKVELDQTKTLLSNTLTQKQALSCQLNSKTTQIENLKKQKLALIEHQESLRYESEQLKEEIRETGEDIGKWEILKQEYVDQIASYGAKIGQLKEGIEGLKRSEEGLKGRIGETEGKVKDLEQRVRETEDEIKALTGQLDEQTETNKQQQKQIIERQNDLDKIVDETNHHQRLLNFETKKAADIDLALNNALLINKEKQTELKQLQQLNSLATTETDQLEIQNTRLQKYLEDVLSHIDNLNKQNTVLAGEIERVQKEDGEIRALLGSKMRVVYGVNGAGYGSRSSSPKPLHDTTNIGVAVKKGTGESWATSIGNSRVADT